MLCISTMDEAQFRCIYCLSTNNPFLRREHPIPESLGNDDIVIPKGFVCDPCNQYFGSKIEQKVLQSAPFGIERLFLAIKSKKGRYPKHQDSSLELQSTGYWDHVKIYSPSPHESLVRRRDGKMVLNPKWAPPNAIAQFLLKMGLGLLVLAKDTNPYSLEFDGARNCARLGRNASTWDFALGVYPNRSDLITDSRRDDVGEIETRQIYQYEMGVMESGDVIFSFVFGVCVFAINLSRPTLTEYILRFNDLNGFKLKSRFQAFKN